MCFSRLDSESPNFNAVSVRTQTFPSARVVADVRRSHAEVAAENRPRPLPLHEVKTRHSPSEASSDFIFLGW